jgi:class I fructose-bisphosphate aldolase
LKFGKTDPRCYSELCKDHPIDYARYQVLNCFAGKIPLINSGGASTKSEKEDFSEAVYTAVVNKRAGGTGLIMGRKAFQKPFKDGVKLIETVQEVYKNPGITIA